MRWLFGRPALASNPAERELALRLYDLPAERVIAAGEASPSHLWAMAPPFGRAANCTARC